MSMIQVEPESLGRTGGPQLILFLAVAFLLVASFGGCAAEEGAVRLGFGQTSQIAGEWEGEITGEAEWSREGVSSRREEFSKGGPMGIRIRSDGSFDWSGTMLGLVLGAANLRYPGDRAVVAVPGDSAERHELTVLWSEYTLTTSRIAILQRTEAPATERKAGGVVLTFDAERNKDGALDYSYTFLPGPSEKSVVRTGRLKRMPSRAEVIREAYKDSPLPDRVVDRQIRRTMEQTPAARRFILIVPRKAKGAIPLLVIVPAWRDEKHAQWYADVWKHQAHGFNVAVAVPVLEDPKYDIWMTPMADETVAKVVEVVRDCTSQAQKAVRPSGTHLIAMGLASVPGHLLWQEDNREFAGLLTKSEFAYYHKRPWEALPLPRPNSAKDKPIWMFHIRWSNPEIDKDTKKAVGWYRQHGYTHVTECFTDDFSDNGGRNMMTGLLLGRQVEGVTVVPGG